MKDGVHNAKIIEADYKWDVSWYLHLTLDYGGAQQTLPNNSCFQELNKLMEAVGVTSFRSLCGCYVRVGMVDGLPVSIGHILLDNWFVLKKDSEHGSDQR